MPHRTAPLLLGAALLAGCSAQNYSTGYADSLVHRNNVGLTVTGIPWGSMDTGADADLVTGLDGNDADVTGYGVQVDVMSYGPTLLVGGQQREYDDVEATELYGGLKFYLGDEGFIPYLHAMGRYGLGFEHPTDALGFSRESDPYWGWGAGGGVLWTLTDHLYLDLLVQYEDLFSEIEAEGLNVEMSGWVAWIGFGFMF